MIEIKYFKYFLLCFLINIANAYSQLDTRIILPNGDEVMSEQGLADYEPYVNVGSGVILLSPTNGGKQVVKPTGDFELQIEDKFSTNNIGYFSIYLYAETNSFTFDTNSIDTSSITNLVVATNSATLLAFSSPYMYDKWFVLQSVYYYSDIGYTSPEPNVLYTLLDGLVFHMPFEDSVSDITGNNTVSSSSGLSYTTGKIGQAAIFNTSYVLMNNTVIENNSPFSIAFWIKDSFANRYESIFESGTYYNAQKIYVFLDTGGVILSGFGNVGGGDTQIFPGGSFANGEWNLFTITYDGDYLIFYQNGVPIETVLRSGFNIDTNGKLLIGQTYNSSSQPGGSLYLTAYIDEFSIWNRGLLEEEVSYLYNGGEGYNLDQ